MFLISVDRNTQQYDYWIDINGGIKTINQIAVFVIEHFVDVLFIGIVQQVITFGSLKLTYSLPY
jgi:predicted RNA-binding protein associated with RNAse of E/G family